MVRRGALIALSIAALVSSIACGDDDSGDHIDEYCERYCEVASFAKCTVSGFDTEGCFSYCVEDETRKRKQCPSQIDSWHACALAADLACEVEGCDEEFRRASCCTAGTC